MLTPETLSLYIQDDPQFNLLLDNKEQFEEDFIEEMIRITYSEVGVLVPSLMNVSDRVPDVIILYGTIANIMRSEGFKELRNQLQYNDANLSSVSVFHKSNDYQSLALALKQEFKTHLSNYATAKFMQEAWGGTTSNSADYDTLYAFSGLITIGRI